MPRQHVLARSCGRLALLLFLALAVACSAPTTPAAPTAAPVQATATVAPPTPTLLPLPPQLPGEGKLSPATDAAKSLQPALVEALGAEFKGAEAPFKDPLGTQAGTSYELTVEGTGELFRGVSETMAALDGVLTSQGWVQDPMYAAGGPTGIRQGYRQGDMLCIASVGWDPSPDANCPKDQPISACQLTPAQQLYVVSLMCAQGL